MGLVKQMVESLIAGSHSRHALYFLSWFPVADGRGTRWEAREIIETDSSTPLPQRYSYRVSDLRQLNFFLLLTLLTLSYSPGASDTSKRFWTERGILPSRSPSTF